ncbi:MAG: hypothetical protein VKN33_08280 [Candidatus Sericytochromatia bacterium]|nr:hypothetical protein [Candidatus Sericytochromatia bacterium]
MQLALAGCAWRWPLIPASLLGTRGDLTILREPRGIDWSTHRITSRTLGAQQQSYVEQQRAAYLALQAPTSPDEPSYDLLATWPQEVNSDWKPGGVLGVPIASISASANHIPNSPATGLAGDSANKYVYLVSQNGYFMRIKGDTPLDSPSVLSLGDTFSNTGITMSPRCNRAYVVSDTGNFYVVDALGSPSMTVIASASLGANANHISPFLDPVLSAHSGVSDVLFVPDNSGEVHKYKFSGGSLTLENTYAIATSITANTNCDGCSAFSSQKFAAPCVAINGRIFIGDTAGNFYDYDSNTSTSKTYGNLGTVGGIYTPPAIELFQSPSNSVNYRDSTTNNLVTGLGADDPIFAFVNVVRDVGPVCAWVNLAERSVTFSEPLFVDDNDTASAIYGSLQGYNYGAPATANTTATAALDAAITLAISGSIPEAGDPATVATPLSAAFKTTTPNHEIRSYFHVDLDTVLPASATIETARIFLYTTPTTATGTINLPGFSRVGGWGTSGSTGAFLRGTSTVWSADNITDSNYPVDNSATRSAYPFNPDITAVSYIYEWNGLATILPGLMRTGRIGVALTHSDTPAPYGEAAAPQFEGQGAADAPYFSVTYFVRSNIPNYPVETAPIIDASNRRVFVYLSNYVYALRYNAQANWNGGSTTPTTQYQATRLARTTGAREAGGAYVQNRISLAPGFNLSNAYAVSHGLSGSDYHVGVSKIALDDSQFGSSDLAIDEPGSPLLLLATNATNTLVVGNTPIASSSGGRFLLIDPFSSQTAGGDLLFTLEGTGRIYRVGTQ